MRSRAILLIAAGCVFAFSACASSGSGTGAARGSRDVITLEELATVDRGSVYDAVARLRPRWLQSRGAGSVTSPTRELPRAYVDGQSVGDVGALRNVDLRDAQEVRYMNAGDATTRYGTNHTAGAILVTTRRG